MSFAQRGRQETPYRGHLPALKLDRPDWNDESWKR
jgi:hypothetical protein